MITLGLTGTGFSQESEPSYNVLRSLSEDVSRSMSETATWCSLQLALSKQLRSRELDPLENLRVPSFDDLGIHAWIDAKRESYKRAIPAINQKRSAFLREAGVELLDREQVMSAGKLLMYWPLETVDDGAAEAGSRKFFNIQDAPPWDCWFLYSEDRIFSWVPTVLVQRAQDGIDANPVDCIRWAKWSDLPS